MARNDVLDRRTALKTLGGATAALVAGCLGGGGGDGDSGAGGGDGSNGGGGGDGGGDGSAGTDGGGPDFGGWFENVGNYDGVVDATGKSEVKVRVGSQANGGYFGFKPPAVRVSSGTTVVWEWTGKGGSHNVVAADGSFQSKLVVDEGHTFEHTFESSGTVRYYCQPHETVGMKGAVVVE